MKAIGYSAIGFVSDAAKVNAIVKVYENVIQTFGKIDVLVVNAGVFLRVRLTDFTQEMFDETSNVNFKGVFLRYKRRCLI